MPASSFLSRPCEKYVHIYAKDVRKQAADNGNKKLFSIDSIFATETINDLCTRMN